jgi:hypothetical protein
MPVFGKKSKDQSQEEAASLESPSGDPPKAATPEDEQAVLDQYFDVETDESPTADLPAVLPADPLAAPAEKATGGGDIDLDFDLMDIFTSEEVEDEDISVLTDGLSQFDSEILLDLSRDILHLLRKVADSK